MSDSNTDAKVAVVGGAGSTDQLTGANSAGKQAAGTEDREATGVFSKSIVISGIRCLLAYIVFPFAAPALGIAQGFEGAIGLTLGSVAIAANLYSIYRFQKANHRWKTPITALNLSVIVLLLVLAARDLNLIFG